MKVRLETYFRLGEVATYPKGTCFEGSLGNLPDWVQDLVKEKNKHISILSVDEPEKASTPTEKPEKDSEELEEPEKDSEELEEPEKDSAPEKKILLKRSKKSESK